MAFIRYVPPDELARSDRVSDPDHIIQVHAILPAIIRQHYELYRRPTHGSGPLIRREREILAVRVSGLNHCPY